MHVSQAIFATTIFGLYMIGAQASPYLSESEAGLARSRRWSDHPSGPRIHRPNIAQLDRRAEAYVYPRGLVPVEERALAPFIKGETVHRRNTDFPSKRILNRLTPRWTDSPDRKALIQRTPMYSAAVNNFRYVGGSSSSSSSCSRSSSSSGDYSETSRGTMKSVQCLEHNYPSDTGGRSPRHRQGSDGRPGQPDLGRSSSEFERAGSVELDARMKTRWLAIVGIDNKIHITGVNGIIGLFIYVTGQGIEGGHIDPRRGTADIMSTIEFARKKARPGVEVKAMIFSNNELDYGLVKNLLRQAFGKLEVKKILYKWHYDRGFWEFVAQFSRSEGIKVTKRWIREHEWNSHVELEGVRIS